MFSVSQKEKIFFAEHLSLLTKGGIPLSEAIETLENEAKSRVFRRSLADISKKILEGQRLSKALQTYPRIFDNFFCNVVRVGEESGTLEENLKYLAQQLKSDYEIRRKVSGALIYPVIVVLLALVVAFSITFFVLPKITGLFQILEIELPLTTRILINTASFLKKNLLLLIIGIFFLILIFKILQRVKFFKFYFDSILLSLPFLNQILKNLNLARFSRTFYTLLKSGMPILEALDICIATQPNEVFKKNLTFVKLRVERGERMSRGLKEFPKIFPSVFSQMVAVGEKSGTLEESFLYLANFYEGEIDSILKNLSGILEPILLILVGAFVAFVALAIIIPIYRFVGSLRFH
jgi:type IV pilus assembly protein PilC